MERRQDDYAILEKQALGILASEASPDNTFDALVIYVSIMPSFENFRAWTLFSDKTGSEYLVRRTLWDRIFDTRRFLDPMAGLRYGWNTTPTIQISVVTLQSSE